MAVLVVAAASLSLTAGCTGIPAIYAYPKISHFPATEINAGGTEVEAFLVKTTRAYQYLPLHVDWHQEVTHLPLFVNSSSISHTSVTLEAFAGTLGPLCYGSEIEHKLKIVLYRPGYELVVLQPWEKKAIDWKPASSIAAQEHALDKLAEEAPFSKDQRRENLFVANEYARLASMSEDGERLRGKAASFRMR
jgi:hypothetical protein